MKLRPHLERIGDRLWLRSQNEWHAASALLHAAEGLAAQLEQGRHRRFLVTAARATDMVRALLAAEQAKAEVVIAHGTLEGELRDQLIERLSITALIESGAERLDTIGNPTLDGPRDGCRIHVMTSGTSGTPKVAEHTLDRLGGPIRHTATSHRARWLLTYPPSTFAGLQVILTAIIGEGTLVEPTLRAPQAFLEACLDGEVTHVSGTPTFWRGLLQALGRQSPPPLEQITIGGEVVDAATLERVKARFPRARMTQIYASTEAGVVFAVDDGQAGFPSRWLSEGVGAVRLRVREGGLEVLSPRRMERYASANPTAITDDGWLRTGDLVETRGARCLFRGRLDRRINVAGFKVCPEEVEGVLIDHEGVAGARVYGIPSPLTGEVLVADVVVTHPGTEEALRLELLQYARSRLEPHKIPRVINTIAELAVTDAGKTSRRGVP